MKTPALAAPFHRPAQYHAAHQTPATRSIAVNEHALVQDRESGRPQINLVQPVDFAMQRGILVHLDWREPHRGDEAAAGPH